MIGVRGCFEPRAWFRSEREESGQFFVDPLGQRQRVRGLFGAAKLLDSSFWDGLGALQNALKNCSGDIIPTDDPCPISNLFEQFHGGAEEVIEDAEVGVNVVHGPERPRGVVSVVADELADLGPILLFNVGVIILFVGAGAGELDFAVGGATPTKGPEMVVDEFGSVVRVDAAQWEGQARFDGAHSVDDDFL